MTEEKKQNLTSENFNSTANLTSNAVYPSTLTISSKDVNDEKAYNPFEHREVKHPNSVLGSIAHLIKGCLGTGILAMPAAFKNSGLIIGSFGILIAGFICTHTMYIFVRTSQELCVLAKKPSMGFAETCGAAFSHGPKGLRSWGGTVKNIVDYSMTLTYLSLVCVYVIFIGSSFKEVLDYYIPNYSLSIQTYCVLTLVPLVLIAQIRNLKYLVPFSAIANFLIIIVFAITLYYVFMDLPPITERNMVSDVAQWPLFLSTVIFAMEGVGVVMPIENEMAKPHKFLGCPGVLNTAMIVVITLYSVVGFFGYVQYGDEVKGSVTLNLPQDEILAQSAKLIMAVVMYLSFALQFYVPMEMITRLLRKRTSTNYKNVIQVSTRTILITICVAIAAIFPNLELVISLVGAVFFSTLGLLIPAVVDTVFLWDKGLGKFNYVLIKNTIIAIISIIVLVSGSYVSVAGLIADMSGHGTHHNVTV